MLSNLTCSPSTLLNYSQLCLEADPPSDCFPHLTSWTNAALDALEAINLTVGVIGNLLTLLAIPFTMKHQRWVDLIDIQSERVATN